VLDDYGVPGKSDMTDGLLIQRTVNRLIKRDKNAIILSDDAITFHNRFYFKVDRDPPSIIEVDVPNYRELYEKYSNELLQYSVLWSLFCQQQKTFVNVSCTIGILEAELLYLRLRHFSPRNVFLLSSADSLSAFIALQAMELNVNGKLISFMNPSDFLARFLESQALQRLTTRWLLINRDHYSAVPLDYIHIDACTSCPYKYLVLLSDILQKFRAGSNNRVLFSVYNVYLERDYSVSGNHIIEWLGGYANVYLENFHSFSPHSLFTNESYSELKHFRKIWLENSNGNITLDSDYSYNAWVLTAGGVFFDLLSLDTEYLKTMLD
jgi:hypothetical protein